MTAIKFLRNDSGRTWLLNIPYLSAGFSSGLLWTQQFLFLNLTSLNYINEILRSGPELEHLTVEC